MSREQIIQHYGLDQLSRRSLKARREAALLHTTGRNADAAHWGEVVSVCDELLSK